MAKESEVYEAAMYAMLGIAAKGGFNLDGNMDEETKNKIQRIADLVNDPDEMAALMSEDEDDYEE